MARKSSRLSFASFLTAGVNGKSMREILAILFTPLKSARELLNLRLQRAKVVEIVQAKQPIGYFKQIQDIYGVTYEPDVD